MITTSSFKDWDSDFYQTVAISADGGKKAGFNGKVYKPLAPKKAFWDIWHNNIGIIPEEENTYYYVEQYYLQVLSKLDVETVFNDLNYKVLLCYESNQEFCHRHIVAAWIELLLGEVVQEGRAKDLYTEKVERPDYIKPLLESIMKKHLNMRGFSCLRALFLFEKGEKLEHLADLIEDENSVRADHYRQSACYYRCDADDAEYMYSLENKNRK